MFEIELLFRSGHVKSVVTNDANRQVLFKSWQDFLGDPSTVHALIIAFENKPGQMNGELSIDPEALAAVFIREV